MHPFHQEVIDNGVYQVLYQHPAQLQGIEAVASLERMHCQTKGDTVGPTEFSQFVSLPSISGSLNGL